MSVDCIKLEEGNKRTQWGPAQVDIDADIALAQSAADAANNAINDATTGLAQRLRSNAANVLSGGAGIAVGSLTWNASGARTGGYGVGLTSSGLVGYLSDGTLFFSLSPGGLAIKGDISGSTGTFGDVSIGTKMYSGQTAYDVGAGFWMSGGGTPQMSIGVAGGPALLWNGSNLIIRKATFDAFSASVSGGLLTAVANGFQGYGNLTATASGGSAPYQYTWSVTYSSASGIAVSYTVSAGAGTSVTSFGGSASNMQIQATITLTVTDSNGRTATVLRQHNVTHGTYGG
jgi:hypothetical protein